MGNRRPRWAPATRRFARIARNPDSRVRVGRRVLRAAALALGALGLLGGCLEDKCPDAASHWRTRRLSVEQMKAAVAPYGKGLARDLMAEGITCETVPIGIDARNDLPVYIRHQCDDLCPDYAMFLVTYADEVFGSAVCEEVGACAFSFGASASTGWCQPYANGRSYCWSADYCNWDDVCDPERRESPFSCPKECACGDGLTGTVVDQIAAAVAIPVQPEDDQDVARHHPDLGLVNSASTLMGALATLLGEGPDLSPEAATAIREGQFVLVTRLQADDPSYDDYAGLFLRQATASGPLALDGHDALLLDPPLTDEDPLCGEIMSGAFRSMDAPARTISLPLPGLWSTPLAAESVTVRDWWADPADAEGIVTAVVTAAETDAVLPPALAAWLTARVAADPSGPVAQRIGATLDGACDPALCPGVAPGEGECAASTPPVITATEVWCHPAFHAALRPVTGRGADGQEDSLFFGFRVTRLVPVTLAEP